MSLFTAQQGPLVGALDKGAIDSRLSFRARGVLAYLTALPPGPRPSSTALAQLTGGPLAEGRDAVRSAIRELVDYGYLTAGQQR